MASTLFERITEAAAPGLSPEKAKDEAVALVTKRIKEITGDSSVSVQPDFSEVGLNVALGDGGAIRVRLLSKQIVLVVGDDFPSKGDHWLGYGKNLREALANMRLDD